MHQNLTSLSLSPQWSYLPKKLYMILLPLDNYLDKKFELNHDSCQNYPAHMLHMLNHSNSHHLEQPYLLDA